MSTRGLKASTKYNKIKLNHLIALVNFEIMITTLLPRLLYIPWLRREDLKIYSGYNMVLLQKQCCTGSHFFFFCHIVELVLENSWKPIIFNTYISLQNCTEYHLSKIDVFVFLKKKAFAATQQNINSIKNTRYSCFYSPSSFCSKNTLVYLQTFVFL